MLITELVQYTKQSSASSAITAGMDVYELAGEYGGKDYISVINQEIIQRIGKSSEE